MAGPLDRFPAGSVTAFPSARFYLVRLKEGGLLALHRERTHLVPGPPAPRSLDFHPIRVENGIVKVDTRRRRQRQRFEASQVTVG